MYNNNNNNNAYGPGYNQFGRGRGGGIGGFNPLGYVVKGVAAGIGLASESIHAHKEQKAAKKAAEEESHHSQSQYPAQGRPEKPDHLGRLKDSRQQSDYDAAEHSREQPEYGTPPAYDAGEKHNVKADKQRSHSAEKGADGTERELEEGDEEQWDLDDAQDELIESEPVNPKKRPFERNPQKIVQHFIDDYPLVQGYHSHGRLALPVVLPQRRPKDRSRGFIRAYAPELMNNDIDQAMFLDFLDTFNLATQASPWLNAINMASFALIPLHLAFLPSQAASLAIALTVSVMKNMQSRKRLHTVLDQMNEDFYQPRGLYCMVLTWNPETDAMEVGININETIHQNLTPPEGLAKVVHSFKPSMGKTNGVAFTETAPLVFPTLDKLDDNHSGEAKTTKEKMKSAMGFTGEYFDRRAQAKFAAEAPDSQLVVGPKPTFTSRYSDPNNATNSGDILALLTAGKVCGPQYYAAGGGNSRGLGGMRGGLGGGFGGIGGGFDPFGRPMGGFGDGFDRFDRFGRPMGGFGGGVDRFGRPMGGFGGGFDRFERPMGRGPLGLIGMLASSRMGGGMGGFNQQQMMQEQMLLDQEQMALDQQRMMINQQQYPNQTGYSQQSPNQYPNQTSRNISSEKSTNQAGEATKRLDETTNKQQNPPQISNPQYPQHMPNQMYSQVDYMRQGPIGLLSNGVMRILRHHVLYLLIVNMPTEEEMAEATKIMDQMRETQKRV